MAGDGGRALAKLAMAGGMGAMFGALVARLSGYSLPLIGLVAAGGVGLCYFLMGRGEALAARRGRDGGLGGAQSWLMAGYIWLQAVWAWVSGERRIADDWRTLIMLVTLPTGFVLLVAACIIGAKARRRERDPNVCAFCGYSVVGLTSGTCPECGRAVRHRDGPTQETNSE
jgi:hypothetical protein